MPYFEIGIYHTKTAANIGTLWRTAHQLGASGVFTIGRRYKAQCTDTLKTPRHIPLRHYLDMDDFNRHRPEGAILVGVEMGGTPLREFAHPGLAIYLLGAEDHGLPPDVLARCNSVVSLEAVCQPSYNVAVAGSIILYDRIFPR